MHAEPININVQEVIEAGPIQPQVGVARVMWGFILFGLACFLVGIFSSFPNEIVWGSYYTSALYFLGLSIGGVMTTAIFQIVRAKWSPPIRRIAEANIFFVPWGIFFLLCTFFGRDYLFPWATSPMPGRESWMQPEGVFLRFGIFFGIFLFFLVRFVKLSLRGDIAMAREKASTQEHWRGWLYRYLVEDWKGNEKEIPQIQRSMSIMAPVLVILYAALYTIFSTEMIVGMDTIWFSNMFGGFQFLGNLYMGWAVTALWALYLAKRSKAFDNTIQTGQFWDLGMLCLGFSMLWGYTFFSQFLPQWYGNMPEETQWMIVRTRDVPWKHIGWLAFTCCFILPFILLLSEDVKKAPKAFAATCFIILFGVWVEKYVVVMPQLSPDRVPFGIIDIGIFLGFLGVYVLCLQSFLRKFPFSPVSHPLTHGSRDW